MYYQKAAELSPREPEAYYGMALAQFRVRFLQDKVNNRLQPIVGRVTADVFANDLNYRKALALGTPAQKQLYTKQAQEIDYIRTEFFKLEKSGLSYDCFICVKVTDDRTGARTEDYKSADDIYYELRRKGFKPFFSENDLRNVAGADYEARILYALNKAECMLIVCSRPEYLMTRWVQNEYSRFLRLVNDEVKESDSIAIAYSGRPIENLPGKNGRLQGINLRALNAMESIVGFVGAHSPEAKKRRAQAAAQQQNETNELRQQLAALQAQVNQNAAQMQAQKTQNFYQTTTPVRQAPQGKLSERDAFLQRINDRLDAERMSADSAMQSARASMTRNLEHTYFGRYPQLAPNSDDPISWTVLARSVDGKMALLVSDMIIDAHRFGECKKPKMFDREKIYSNNYEASEIRQWLNNDFFNRAFNASEKSRVVPVVVDNSMDSTGATGNRYVCKNTQDRVFLLSKKEVTNLFKSEPERMRGVSKFASMRGAYAKRDGGYTDLNGNLCGLWYLRSPHPNMENYVQYVNYDGTITNFGADVERFEIGVVPAIWIRI